MPPKHAPNQRDRPQSDRGHFFFIVSQSPRNSTNHKWLMRTKISIIKGAIRELITHTRSFGYTITTTHAKESNSTNNHSSSSASNFLLFHSIRTNLPFPLLPATHISTIATTHDEWLHITPNKHGNRGTAKKPTTILRLLLVVEEHLQYLLSSAGEPQYWFTSQVNCHNQ